MSTTRNTSRGARAFNYDILASRFGSDVTPGTGLRVFFGTASADAPGSFNISGVKSPAIDALIEQAIAANSRKELDIAGRALDRVLRAELFWVPNWHKASHLDRPLGPLRLARDKAQI